MTGEPDVTVIIPTHNRRALLLRTLQSVTYQEQVRLKVVVVDDGGSDGSSQTVLDLGRDDVEVIRHEQAKGVSAARNAGLARVATPWVAFVDDDDVWAPDKLAAQLSALRSNPLASWACVGALHVDGDLRVLSHTAPPPPGDVAQLLRKRNVVPGGGSGVVVDTQLAKEIQGFDEKISLVADWDFNFRLGRRSPLAAVNRPLLAYFVHSDSMLHDPVAYLRELEYMEAKYRGLAEDQRFLLDRGFWHANLAWMARGLGDLRTARALLRDGIARSGVSPVAREIGRLVSSRLSRPRGRPSESPEPAAWMQRFGDEA